MLRIVGGIVIGIIAGFAAVYVIEMIGHSFYPLPAEMNLQDFDDVGALIRSMPLGAQAFVVGGWLGGALVGGFVAALIARRRWAAWAIAGLVAVASILNILMIPHPEWMQVAAIVTPALGGLIAGHFGGRIHDRARPGPLADA